MVRLAVDADAGAAWDLHRAAFGRDLEADLFAALGRDGDLRPDLSYAVVLPDGTHAGHVAVSTGWAGDRPVRSGTRRRSGSGRSAAPLEP